MNMDAIAVIGVFYVLPSLLWALEAYYVRHQSWWSIPDGFIRVTTFYAGFISLALLAFFATSGSNKK